jgi:pimeloyl-ACP methyl ester carboxylesterase
MLLLKWGEKKTLQERQLFTRPRKENDVLPKGRLFETSGIKIHYLDIGSGIPVLSIHGSRVDHRVMTGCLERVFKSEKGYRRIYFDMPGMGKSGPPDKIKTADDMLSVILALIDHLIPNEKFLLASQSYGGFLAMGLQRARQAAILGTLFVCPMVLPENKGAQLPPPAVLKKDASFLAQLNPKDLPAFTHFSVVQTPATFKRFKNEILDGWRLHDKHFLDEVHVGRFTSSPPDADKVFDLPTLVLLGKQDISVGYKDQAELFLQYPRATVAVLDRAGHNLQVEQGDVTDALIKEWLQRVREQQ